MTNETNIQTIIATGAADMATGSRLAMRGLIWLAYGHHLECHVSDGKPADYKRKVNAALLGLGRGKGEASTKSTQSNTIGAEFHRLFAAELASEYGSTSDFIAACFNAAEANGATSVLKLKDWAQHGNADHAEAMKAQKAAEAADKKAEAEQVIERDAASSAAINQPELGFVPKVKEVQSLNLEPEQIENTIAAQLATMDDKELAQLAKLVSAERAARKQGQAVAA